ncbi:hypothetical protein GH714_019750 [Hevea brasiliensis]|uniref:S1 motif domain-containing protein n=1 Tax=Hevea brasiliensis TaxID=3981 RepID=A0A6A6KRE0_HEVBR|nr:hypothetical protein GH714_019750 [Hevea brasiliensis]
MQTLLQPCKSLPLFNSSLPLSINNCLLTYNVSIHNKCLKSSSFHLFPNIGSLKTLPFSKNIPPWRSTHISFCRQDDAFDDFSSTQLPEKAQNHRTHENEELELLNKPSPVATNNGIGNENKLDVNVGADLLGTMLTKEVLPLYDKEMEYLLCDMDKDSERFMVRGKMGIVKDEAAVSGGAGPGRPVVETGTILFAEVLGRTLSGRPLLSTRRLFRRIAWHRVRQVKELNEPIEVKITEWNTGGLLTRIEGLRAFLPKAELMNRVNNFKELKENVGRRIYVLITRINETNNDLILSEREAWEMLNLQEGTLLEGTVKKIFSYGAQVRIGETNRSGLLHISNISRSRVTAVHDLLKVDEKVKALVVKSMFPDKISLSIADLESEPGLFISNKEIHDMNSKIDQRSNSLITLKYGVRRLKTINPRAKAADPSAKASSSVLSSWNPSSLTPCSWQGITCSPQNRVISLSLPNTFLNLSSLPSELSSLTCLQLLNLSSTNISGTIPTSFGQLTHLRLLDLSSNSISGYIPQELGLLSSLQFLYLNSNRLSGRIPPQLANLTSLQVFCLQDNLFNGSIPSQLGSLISLQQFRVGGNPYLTGDIPPQLGLLTNLTTFGAAATGLSGVIPPTFGKLINLQTLALYDTEVFGSIPLELGLCSELRNLYLHMNKLTGSIPQLGKLQKLTSLLLWGNALSGHIPAELSNCSSMVVLDASANDLSGEIPSDLGKLVVLEQLHLSDNSLTGAIPWQLSNCTSLTALQLDKNQLSASFGNCTELYALDLSRNKLTGTIPDEVFGLKKLSKLLLLGNSLSGGLPRSIANCQSLVRLRLGENQLSGQIPKEIGQLQNLVFLDLYVNHFSGAIPIEIANITVLELLDVHNNHFTGEIPSQLGELVNLEQLDLSRNSFNGEIPWSFGNFSYLNKLILNNNLLSGSIPRSIKNLQKLTLLDLSYNSLSGPIPPEIGYVTSLTISLDLSSNAFTGELPQTMSSLTQLQSIDLSHNLLYGNIKVLGSLTSLTSLNISCKTFQALFL